jgi:hypothetical protein
LGVATILVAALLTQAVGQYLHLSGHDHTGVGDSAQVIESHHHSGAGCVEHANHDSAAAARHRVEPGCDHEPSHAERCVLSWLWHQSFEPEEGLAYIIAAIDVAQLLTPHTTAAHSSVPIFQLAPKQSPPHVA